MYILAFDTSSSQLSLALVKDQKIIAKNVINESNQQSQLLIVQIENILRENDIWYQDLDLITTIQGPGSFTGVRIGLAAAKTIKITTNLPLILTNALEALYYPHRHSQNSIFTAIDAGIGELFIAHFHNQKITLSPCLIKVEEIENFLPQNEFLVCGSGKNFVAEIAGKKNLTFTIQENSQVDCADLAFLALEKYQSEQILQNQTSQKTNTQKDEALYIREPNITQRKK